MDDVIDSDIEARRFQPRQQLLLGPRGHDRCRGRAGSLGRSARAGRSREMFTCDEFHGFVGRLPDVLLVAFGAPRASKTA